MSFLAPLLAAGGGAGAAGASGAAAPIAAGSIPGLQGGAPLVGGKIAEPASNPMLDFFEAYSKNKPEQQLQQNTQMQVPQIQNPIASILAQGGTNPPANILGGF